MQATSTKWLDGVKRWLPMRTVSVTTKASKEIYQWSRCSTNFVCQAVCCFPRQGSVKKNGPQRDGEALMPQEKGRYLGTWLLILCQALWIKLNALCSLLLIFQGELHQFQKGKYVNSFSLRVCHLNSTYRWYLFLNII
jgi:hypothetical protein